MLRIVHKLAKKYLTLQVKSATTERSFSSLYPVNNLS